MTEIIIYSKPECPYSTRLKNLLDTHSINYKDINIEKNKKAAKEIITRNGHTPTPQVEFHGRIIFDYSTEEELAHELLHVAGIAHHH